MRFNNIPSSILLGAVALTCIETFTFVDAAPSSSKVSREQPLRVEAIKDAFLHAWNGYARFAFGHDELQTVSNIPSDSRNGWGATIFDALDTMIIMGLNDEYSEALDFVTKVDWNESIGPSKTFETTIRYLGGLLSAYDLRNDPELLAQAVRLTEQVILPAYNTDNGIPSSYVDVQRRQPVPGSQILLAEFGSLQLELTRLSQLTGNQTYGTIANKVIEKTAKVAAPLPGLYKTFWDLSTFSQIGSSITISGGSDSFYEYLLKTHLLKGGNESLQIGMWRNAVDSMHEFLRSESTLGRVFLADMNDNTKLFQTGELVCFIPGNLLLGGYYLDDKDIIGFASELMDACSDAWGKLATGIAPESWDWIDKSENAEKFSQKQRKLMETEGILPNNPSYDLRPETLESLFYFYRLTGDQKYRDTAWKIFQAIEKYCKTPSGYTRIGDVTNPEDVSPQDFQESYFFAETLKYLYLIFSDPSTISLDDYVFNTEGHPFKLTKPIQVQANFD